jgi:hypothetical protein
VNVIEYYDSTEYFNIDTDTSISSIQTGVPTNSRYWEKDQAMNTDGIQLKLDQIDRFYLSTMLMKSSGLGHNELTDFLDTIYDFAARKDFMDGDDNFQTQLGNGLYTNTVYPLLTSMMKYRDEISSRLSSGYEREEDT